MNQALRNMKREALEKKTTVVVKFEPWRYEGAKQGLRDINPSLVHMYRRNILDRYICTIRDCFDTGFQNRHPEKQSYPVDATTGEETDLCYQRRFRKDVAVKAVLNVETLAKRFQEFEQGGRSDNAKSRELFKKDYASVATEDLEAFEFSDSIEALDKSVQTWIEVFQSWGVTPDVPKIGKYLEEHPERGNRPLKPHSETVYNAEQVRNALETNPDLKKYLQHWRDR